MTEEEVNEEVLVGNGEPELTSNQREADTQFEQKLSKVIEQTTLQIAFMGIVAQREKIEIIGIFRDVARQVRLRQQKRAVEICNRLALTMHPSSFNLVHKDITAPSVLNCRLCIPDTILGRIQFFEDGEVVVLR